MYAKAASLPIFMAILVWSSFSVASPSENLSRALTFKTVSHQDRNAIDYVEFDKLHAFLRTTYPEVFSRLEVEVVNDYSLLIVWPGTGASLQPILFTAHMDVVPIEPGTEGDWAHPPFDGVIEDGVVYGRGALDDKQGVIGLLEAAEQLLEEGFAPARTVVFAFGHDEEIFGYDGGKAIAARLRERGMHFSWMVDEGGMIITDNPQLADYPTALVNVQEKSYLTLTLTATGEGGHSSNPPRVSTIGRLSAAVTKIEQNPFPPRLVGSVKSMLETMGAHSDQPNRFILENLWLTGGMVAWQLGQDRATSSFVRTTTALTMFNAGVKENVVPQRAQAMINFRLLPGDSTDMVVSYIEGLIDDPNIVITPDERVGAPPMADITGGGFEIIKQATAAVYPDAVVVPSLLPGVTDSRHYSELADNHYRYHGVSMTMSQTTSIHGTNEYVSVESFEKSVEIARQMIRLGSR